jgi:hypothetical protein
MVSYLISLKVVQGLLIVLGVVVYVSVIRSWR